MAAHTRRKGAKRTLQATTRSTPPSRRCRRRGLGCRRNWWRWTPCWRWSRQATAGSSGGLAGGGTQPIAASGEVLGETSSMGESAEEDRGRGGVEASAMRKGRCTVLNRGRSRKEAWARTSRVGAMGKGRENVRQD